mmetsp:Transcript_41883/g.125176  ORF Transcript_41883/g.125176 Transcript_41883/m.125176 type:complete len:406 (-) Transcript_41883:13-1230(-)
MQEPRAQDGAQRKQLRELGVALATSTAATAAAALQGCQRILRLQDAEEALIIHRRQHPVEILLHGSLRQHLRRARASKLAAVTLRWPTRIAVGGLTPCSGSFDGVGCLNGHQPDAHRAFLLQVTADPTADQSVLSRRDLSKPLPSGRLTKVELLHVLHGFRRGLRPAGWWRTLDGASVPAPVLQEGPHVAADVGEPRRARPSSAAGRATAAALAAALAAIAPGSAALRPALGRTFVLLVACDEVATAGRPGLEAAATPDQVGLPAGLREAAADEVAELRAGAPLLEALHLRANAGEEPRLGPGGCFGPKRQPRWPPRCLGPHCAALCPGSGDLLLRHAAKASACSRSGDVHHGRRRCRHYPRPHPGRGGCGQTPHGVHECPAMLHAAWSVHRGWQPCGVCTGRHP